MGSPSTRKRTAAKTEDGTAKQAQGEQCKHCDENRTHSLISPVKPMKASDMRPAVIMPIAAPWNDLGTSAMAMRSRMAANSTSTRKSPVPRRSRSRWRSGR